MKINSLNKLKPKKLIVFDLDGTLVHTKSLMERDMTDLIIKLLRTKKVAIIGGGKYQIFTSLFVSQLPKHPELLHNLFLFPTTATAFYRYNKGWKNIYSHPLTQPERDKIKKTFQRVLKEINYVPPQQTYGKIVEDRGTQVTFSALGQDIVKVLGKRGVVLKEKWTRENTPIKLQIAKLMAKYLPKLEVRAAGHTSIDITKKGIDKAYGLRQIEKHLGIKIKDMLFVGDAIFPGGNDFAITKTPIDYVKVRGPKETKRVIRAVLRK